MWMCGRIGCTFSSGSRRWEVCLFVHRESGGDAGDSLPRFTGLPLPEIMERRDESPPFNFRLRLNHLNRIIH